MVLGIGGAQPRIAVEGGTGEAGDVGGTLALEARRLGQRMAAVLAHLQQRRRREAAADQQDQQRHRQPRAARAAAQQAARQQGEHFPRQVQRLRYPRPALGHDFPTCAR